VAIAPGSSVAMALRSSGSGRQWHQEAMVLGNNVTGKGWYWEQWLLEAMVLGGNDSWKHWFWVTMALSGMCRVQYLGLRICRDSDMESTQVPTQENNLGREVQIVTESFI